jgi:protein gp37
MGQQTEIAWCDSTFNPWEGCQKVSPGCDHCYAETRNARFGGGVAPNWGPGAPRRRTSKANWNLPMRWNAEHEAFHAAHGRRQRVFCASLSDWADNAVVDEWRDDLADLIRATPNLVWLMLTKRISNAETMLASMFPDGMPENVMVGATIVHQEEADRDIQKLLRTPAKGRFLSIEPLLGHINLERWLQPAGLDTDLGLSNPGIDWVIVGGESGPGARPLHPDWVHSLRKQCSDAGVPFLFKQWGEWVPMMGHAEGITVQGDKFTHQDGTIMGLAGKKAAGRLLNGKVWNEFPA